MKKKSNYIFFCCWQLQESERKKRKSSSGIAMLNKARNNSHHFLALASPPFCIQRWKVGISLWNKKERKDEKEFSFPLSPPAPTSLDIKKQLRHENFTSLFPLFFISFIHSLFSSLWQFREFFSSCLVFCTHFLLPFVLTLGCERISYLKHFPSIFHPSSFFLHISPLYLVYQSKHVSEWMKQEEDESENFSTW